MDCSKTENFLKELDRMCKETNCSNCRLCAEVSCGAAYKRCNKDDYSTLFRTVQKWSDEHPQETILEHFKKILPNMKMYNEKVPNTCLQQFDTTLVVKCREGACTLCWSRPYEEAIRGSEE